MPGNNLNAYKNSFIRKSSLASIGLFLLVYIVPLGVLPITIPDEARYSEIPREMTAFSIVSEEQLLSSACWFYGRHDVYLMGDPGELIYGFNYEDSKARHLNPGQFKEFILEHSIGLLG